MSTSTPPALARRGFLALGLTTGVTVALARPSSAATVGYTYQVQQTQSWCSAASSRIALSARDHRPSQSSLAASLGLRDGHGLQDATLIASVLNSRLGIGGRSARYYFRQPAAGTLKARLRSRVVHSIDAGYPVVINMNQVDGTVFSSGHYIAIVGYRAGEYKIADPVTSSRNGVWRDEDDIVRWNKLNRFTAYGA